jgi:hypothetical protein
MQRCQKLTLGLKFSVPSKLTKHNLACLPAVGKPASRNPFIFIFFIGLKRKELYGQRGNE